MYAIRSVDIRSCAKITGALYGALALLAVPVGIIATIASAFQGKAVVQVLPMSVLLIFAPFLYGALGFLVGAVFAWAYNLVAGWTGGIEVELAEPRGL